jgi:poly(3-hydroxybutyrate) depolymerase
MAGAMRAAGIARILLALFAAAPAASLAAEPLPRLVIERGSLTVSGVSAGGYMATQYQVAYAKDVAGAGIVGAGPWLCAEGIITRALDDCTKGGAAGPETSLLAASLRASAAARLVDDPSWLATDRVWIFHGAKDRKVGAAVSDSLLRFYKEFIPLERMRYETQVAAAHGFPTVSEGGACDGDASPWILACGYDAAGEMLKYLYGGLSPPPDAVTGTLLTYDQKRYVARASLASMADEGFLFVPKDCAAGKACRVHVAFHGCRQGIEFIGRRFAREAGYNRWADTNRIVVLYPQAAKSWFWPFNPWGCWDWWGYSGADYATRNAAQLATVHAMLTALGAN